MTHHHTGGKQKNKARLAKSLHHAKVLERRKKSERASLLEFIKQHNAAIVWLADRNFFHRNPKEPLSAFSRRGEMAINTIRDNVLRHHVTHAFQSRINYLKAEEKAIRTAKRIQALKAWNRAKAQRR